MLKVRLQMQLVGQKGPLTGMVFFTSFYFVIHNMIHKHILLQSYRVSFQSGLFVQVVKKEGARSLYLGLIPALTRSVLYGGLRLGLYEPSKYVCQQIFDSTNILSKIASGGFSGALATALTNPIEVLKVTVLHVQF